MSDSEDAKSEVEIPASINPYQVLGLQATATENDVKKAYRKAALKNHPDKVSAGCKEVAHTAFQKIAFAYAILSDPFRRKHFDETGSTDDTLSVDPDWSWSSFYRAQYADVVTSDAIYAFTLKYKGSGEECADLLAAYTAAEGDMDMVYTEVMLSDVVQDDERFRAIIDKAIKAGQVENFPKYHGEDNKKRDKRRRKAKKEAQEAEELAKKLGVHNRFFGGIASGASDPHDEKNYQDTITTAVPKGKKMRSGDTKNVNDSVKDHPEAGLAALIRSRQNNRPSQDAFLERLAEKYGANGTTKKGIDEPTEEAFQAASRRLETNRKKRKTPDDNHEQVSVQKKTSLRIAK